MKEMEQYVDENFEIQTRKIEETKAEQVDFMIEFLTLWKIRKKFERRMSELGRNWISMRLQQNSDNDYEWETGN